MPLLGALMLQKDFMDYLRERNEDFKTEEGEMDNSPGVYVWNMRYDTQTFFSRSAIERMELQDLVKVTNQGRNVENITRVTGFFSKTQGWNKGKTGELKQRHRVDV